MDTASAIIWYIESLDGFKIERTGAPHLHMGAIITHAILQAGIDWKPFVFPRVQDVRKHSEARTTSGFLALLRAQGLSAGYQP